MYSSDFVRPLKSIENRFLEVLIREFILRRTPTGMRLTIHFTEEDDAVWNWQGKNHVRDMIPSFAAKRREHQKEIDAFWNDPNQQTYHFRNPAFPFRYASGGALPLIRFRGTYYYGLIYRECFPVGWNLANGGSDTRQEMLNPFITVERELREELLIADFQREQRYVFDLASDNPEDMPEHVVARDLWTERLALDRPLGKFDRVLTPTRWLDGPDVLDVAVAEGPRHRLRGCYSNSQSK